MVKTFKHRKNTNNKTRSKKNFNKISITVDFTKKDKGYNDMLNSRLLKFIIENVKKGNNLIQTQDNKPFYCNKKTILHLQAVPVKKWNQYPLWSEIKCKKINDYLLASPCKIGINNKIFVKLKSNEFLGGFGTYIIALHMNSIDETKHIKFVEALNKTFKKNPIRVHNEDVDWFHLKQAA